MKLDSSLIRHSLTLVALCGILYFPQLGRIPFFNKGEPREAILVQEIVQDGNWLFPLKWGEEIPSKPPLFHWFGALSSVVWGEVTEATVRFPSALFATLGVLLLYILGRVIFESESALFGSLILATSAGYQTHAVSARVDMTLTFFVTLALVIFYLLHEGFLTGQLWSYAFYFVLGVGVLAKGPIGLILPGMVIFGFVGLRKRWDLLLRLCFHKGTLLTLAIVISWYGTALVRGGEDFLNRQVMHENLARFFVYGEGGSGHQKPIYYYFPYLILEGLPWSLFLPFAIMDWMKKKTVAEDRSLFLLLWAGLIFLFFSLSAGKRSAYLLPLYPPFSLLIAHWLRQPVEEGTRRIGLRTVGLVSLLVGLMAVVPLLGILVGKDVSWFVSNIGLLLKPKDQLHLSVVHGALVRAGWLFLPFLLLSALLWLLAARRFLSFNVRAGTAYLVCACILTWLVVQGALMASIAEARSYKPFIVEVNRRVMQNDSLSIYGEDWDHTSVLFYRGARIPVLKDDLLSVREKILQSGGYYIMSEREWRKIGASGRFAFSPELRSEGTGPDGKDPIVLIRGPEGQKGE